VPVPTAFVPDTTETDDLVADGARYRRLSPCPNCSGRRRTLVEVGGGLVGRCLGCGEDLGELGLETELQSHVVIVGRGGQGILAVDRSAE
jgi:hypothetical protein